MLTALRAIPSRDLHNYNKLYMHLYIICTSSSTVFNLYVFVQASLPLKGYISMGFIIICYNNLLPLDTRIYYATYHR